MNRFVPPRYTQGKHECTVRRMDAPKAIVHLRNMPKHGKPPHYLREWRLHHGYTLERLAEMVETVGNRMHHADSDRPALRMTHATLSRIERFKLPYYQQLLEVLAEIYNVDEGALIMRKPEGDASIWEMLDKLEPAEREQVARVIQALRPTGT